MLPSLGYKTKYIIVMYPEVGSVAEMSVKTLNILINSVSCTNFQIYIK